MKRLIVYLLTLLFAMPIPPVDGAVRHFLMPKEQFARFKNIPDPKNGEGSCVQASVSMCGNNEGVPAAELLLKKSRYGDPVLGGSWPQRVQDYCRERKIPIWNIEGAQTLGWIEWQLRRGGYAAITYGVAHMITAVGVSDDGKSFWIVDNNYPTECREVTRSVFVREHRRFGGGWAVILKMPGPPPWVLPDRTTLLAQR
jgi:hypothetical protein